MRHLLLFSFLLFLSSCGTTRGVDKIRVIHFTDDFHVKQNLGTVKEKRCQYQAGKYKGGQTLSFETAYEDLIRQKGGLSYIEDLVFKADNQSISDFKGNTIAGKDCIIVEGIGYK